MDTTARIRAMDYGSFFFNLIVGRFFKMAWVPLSSINIALLIAFGLLFLFSSVGLRAVLATCTGFVAVSLICLFIRKQRASLPLKVLRV